MEKLNPLRRMRVRLFAEHRPKVWASYFEPPGRASCYCHAPTLEEMWKELEAYFKGEGECPPQRVQDHMMKYWKPSDAARSSEGSTL